MRELRYRGKFWVFPTKRLEPIWGLDKDRFVGLRGWVGGWGCLRIKRWGFEIARGSWSSNTTPVIYYKSTWIGDEDQNILIVICVWHLLFFSCFWLLSLFLLLCSSLCFSQKCVVSRLDFVYYPDLRYSFLSLHSFLVKSDSKWVRMFQIDRKLSWEVWWNLHWLHCSGVNGMKLWKIGFPPLHHFTNRQPA